MALVFFFSSLAALLTFELSKLKWAGATRASAILSIAFAIISRQLFVESDAEAFSAIFFGGSFVGMSSAERFGRGWVLWAGLLFGGVYWSLVHYISGLGGALGLSAFLSVSLSAIKLKGVSVLAQRKLAR